MAQVLDRERHGVDGGKNVNIDKAVVDWADQGIGHRVRERHELAVPGRRIDHHEIEVALEGSQFLFEEA